MAPHSFLSLNAPIRSLRQVLLAGAVAAAAIAVATPSHVRATCECRGVVVDAVDAYADAPHAALALARIFLALAPGSRMVPLRMGAFGVSLAAAVAAVSSPADGGGASTCGAGVDADAAVAYAGYTVLASWFEEEPAKARELDALFAAHGYTPGKVAAGHVGAVAARRVMARNKQGPPPASPYKPVNPASPGYDATCDALVAAKWQPQCVQMTPGAACMPQVYMPGPLVNGSLFGSGGRKTVAELVAFLPPPPEAGGPLGELDLSLAAAAGDPEDDSFVSQHSAVLTASASLGDYGKAAADYFGPPAALRTFSLAVSEAAVRNLPLAEAATLFAMSGAAIADAFIATQYVKARYSSVRPLTVLQCGGHSRPLVGWAGPYQGVRQLGDSERWGPYLQTPGFPGYTSGHSAVAAAGSRVLARYFGRGSTPRAANCGRVPAGGSTREPRVLKGSPGYVAGVTDVANRGPRTPGYAPAADVTLCWSSWWGYADLVSASRLSGGIHIPVDNSLGLAVGVAAADQVVEWVKGGMA
ncbi:hypothetical protein MMPV_000329 [Pyropia vietnamensis]